MCKSAVGLVGDLCRAIGSKMAAYSADLILILVQLLSVCVGGGRGREGGYLGDVA